ncbi:hypothetical protein R1flu_003159 [Riccia fluitans]|uniref:DUF676 domain-containing protein n=1 Tax=Riccia fluitans TaxID=41844 RepID=A0ABD1YBZ2_9MARC
MRSFIMKKKNVNTPKPVGRLSFESEDHVLELKVQQKIFKTFQIDHSLSLLKNLSQRNEHRWNMAHNTVAPTPVSDVINATTASSSGCSENSESRSIIDETVPVLRQEVVENTFPTEAAEDMAHFAAVTTLDVNGGRDATRVNPEELNGKRVATKLNDYLYEIYKPENEPHLDILLFHGLKLENKANLHVSTWISGEMGEPHVWPKTWVVEDFPSARVLSVSYDSSIYQTAQEGRIDLHNAAEGLMYCLELEMNTSFRPLILVGHSFGGILIKQLCLHAFERQRLSQQGSLVRSLLERIRGIFFMGTPHRGMIHEGFEKLSGENAGPLIKHVRSLNEELARLHDRFDKLRIVYKWKISEIGELKETKWGVFQGVMVPEGSARYGDPFLTINADHDSLSKPAVKNSIIYAQLKSLIQRNSGRQVKSELFTSSFL